MKGIVFTLDSIFALVIATAGISILLYFTYQAPTPALLSYTSTQSILDSLLGTGVGTLSSSHVAAAMLAKGIAANETWPQLGQNAAHTGDSPAGPENPSVAYQYSLLQAPISGAVAGYGDVYFATSGALYALNGTFGTLAWAIDMPSVVASEPALYSGMIIYANTTNVTAVSALNGSLVWSAGIPGSTLVTTPILVYGDQVILGGANHFVYGLFASNGTVEWHVDVGAVPTDIAIVQGAVAVRTSGTITAIGASGGNAAELFAPVGYTGMSSSIAGIGGTIVFGNGTAADGVSLNGSNFGSFPQATTSPVTGVATGSGLIVYQGTSSMSAYTPSGIQLWSRTMPPSLGAAYPASTPVIGGSIVYSLWSGGWLVAQNINNGAVLWTTNYPYSIASPNMSIAYGNLYVPSNQFITAYGACPASSSDSVLSAAVSLYLNGQGSCATALVNGVVPMYNYSVFINGTFAPGLAVDNFTGAKGLVFLGNSSNAETNAYSWSLWIDPNSWQGLNNTIMAENCSGSGCPYMVEQASQRLLFSNDGTVPRHNVSATVSSNKWQNVVGTYNYITGTISIYVDGALVESSNTLPVLPRARGGMYLGAFNTLPSADSYSGRMANVQIYGTALTGPQVEEVYQNGLQGAPISGALAWYPMEGGADDFGPYNYTGYVYGGVDAIGANYLPGGLINSFEVSKASATVGIPVASYPGASRAYDVGVYAWR